MLSLAAIGKSGGQCKLHPDHSWISSVNNQVEGKWLSSLYIVPKIKSGDDDSVRATIGVS